jgi:hypothetical protein
MTVAFGTYDVGVLCFVHLDTKFIGDGVRIDRFEAIQLARHL